MGWSQASETLNNKSWRVSSIMGNNDVLNSYIEYCKTKTNIMANAKGRELPRRNTTIKYKEQKTRREEHDYLSMLMSVSFSVKFGSCITKTESLFKRMLLPCLFLLILQIDHVVDLCQRHLFSTKIKERCGLSHWKRNEVWTSGNRMGYESGVTNMSKEIQLYSSYWKELKRCTDNNEEIWKHD